MFTDVYKMQLNFF